MRGLKPGLTWRVLGLLVWCFWVLVPTRLQAQCFTAGGPWRDSHALQYDLNYNSTTGGITGSVRVPSFCRRQDWTNMVVGNYNRQINRMELLITNPVLDDPVCPRQTTLTSGAFLGGCERLIGTYRNTNGFEGVAVWDRAFPIPTHEDVYYMGWDFVPGWYRINYLQVLRPPGVQFPGRIVTEVVGGGFDGCNFPGSGYPIGIITAGSSWLVTQSIEGYYRFGPDQIGVHINMLNAFRSGRLARHLPFPCQSYFWQQMYINTGGVTKRPYGGLNLLQMIMNRQPSWTIGIYKRGIGDRRIF